MAEEREFQTVGGCSVRCKYYYEECITLGSIVFGIIS